MSALFIFRRDLRLVDNTALIAATEKYKDVKCCFIMTPEQLQKNNYKSDAAVQFMYESLHELKDNITFFFGKPEQVLNKILKQNKTIEVFVNQDYTLYAKKRDEKLEKVCKQNNVLFSSHEDHMMHPYGAIKTKQNKIYSIFTPYYNTAKELKVPLPKKTKHKNFSKLSGGVSLDKLKDFFQHNPKPLIQGGRKQALKAMKKNFDDYSKNRDKLTYSTTLLSAYIKFGCVSIREVYHRYKSVEPLARQLYWHDFYTTLGHRDIEFTEKRIYQPKQNISWQNQQHLKAWKEGKTGFPVVDATMRQLKHENYCHNRGRLIASGWIKFMFIDWRKAEQHYAQNLRDYSPYANYYNWCWAMSFGPFSTPYFRIMNVFAQGKKHDPDCEYIKKWVPELINVETKHIHEWDKFHNLYDIDYPAPVVDYKEQREKTKKAYKSLFKN